MPIISKAKKSHKYATSMACAVLVLFLQIIFAQQAFAACTDGALELYNKEDYAGARVIFNRCAERGDYISQNLMGWFSESGNGTKQDYVEAAKWYLQAAEQNNGTSMQRLGVFNAGGHGMSQDIVQAAVWFSLAKHYGNKLGASDADGILMFLNEEEKANVQSKVDQWVASHQ